MVICEKCWSEAYLKMLTDSSKSQTEHYFEIIKYKDKNNIICNGVKS